MGKDGARDVFPRWLEVGETEEKCFVGNFAYFSIRGAQRKRTEIINKGKGKWKIHTPVFSYWSEVWNFPANSFLKGIQFGSVESRENMPHVLHTL